jgi:toxin ParE1/3/4
MRLAWTARARRARTAAIDYIAEDSPKAALAQLGEIEQQIKSLPDHPNRGRLGRVAGTRELVINRTPFIVVYRIEGDAMRILHFLHGAQQWPPDST